MADVPEKGKDPINPRGLARLLKPFGIMSENLKIAQQFVKGYKRQTFIEAWIRYLPLQEDEKEALVAESNCYRYESATDGENQNPFPDKKIGDLGGMVAE